MDKWIKFLQENRLFEFSFEPCEWDYNFVQGDIFVIFKAKLKVERLKDGTWERGQFCSKVRIAGELLERKDAADLLVVFGETLIEMIMKMVREQKAKVLGLSKKGGE